MGNIRLALIFGLLVVITGCLVAEEERMYPELRVVPSGNVYFICRAQNGTSIQMLSEQSDRLFYNHNTLSYIHLGRDRPSSRGAGLRESYSEHLLPPPLRLNPGERYVRLVTNEEANQQFGLLDTVVSSHGSYWQMQWIFGNFGFSNPIHVAFPDDQGEIAPPIVDTLTDDYQTRKHTLSLAFIFHREQPRELGFLVINSTQQDIKTPNALVGASSLIAESAAVDFRQELILPNDDAEVITVRPGAVAEWRLPWQEVLNLIPAEDLERIKAAGGDLDLVWKVGELESSPLPLTLVVPEPSDHHQGDFEIEPDSKDDTE